MSRQQRPGSDRGRGRGRGYYSGPRMQHPTFEDHRNDTPRGRGHRSDRGGRGFTASGTDNTRSPQASVNPHRPFGYRELNVMLNFEPSQVLQLLSDSKKEFEGILQKEMPFDWYVLIMKLLAKVGESIMPSVHSELFTDLLMVVSRSTLLKKFPTFLTVVSSERKHDQSTITQLHRDMATFFKVFLERAPSSACNSVPDKFFELITTMKMLLSVNNYTVPEEIYADLRTLQMMLEDARTQVLGDTPENDARHKLNRLARNEEWSYTKPPDDYRTLNVIPTIEDLRTDEKPFLRPAIIEHEYRSADDYLDIQFRLMREDFFYPLRSGIKKYLELKQQKRERSRVDDVRIYENVRFVEYDLVKGSHLISFSLAKLRRVVWDCSKRLMHGSLLCLTSNDFRTGILATVCKRDLKLLAEGKISIQIEDVKDVKKYEKMVFTMVESSSFFQTYRNVLSALQQLKAETLPMKDFILGKEVGRCFPDYLQRKMADQGDAVIYDLSVTVLKNEELEERRQGLAGLLEQLLNLRVNQRERDAPLAPVGPRDPVEVFTDNPRLKRIEITDFNEWPSHDQLNLDRSQLDAFRLALLQKCVLIQGPPGTGKTFIGLKIVQALLQNQNVWRIDDEGEPISNPIVVVCYTNHALDQFLEGIMKFTKKIVRIGGMSKSEEVQKFSLFELRKSLKDGGVRSYHRKWAFERRTAMRDMLNKLLDQDNLASLVDKKIILNEKFLVKEFAMSNDFQRLLLVGRPPGATASRSSVISDWLRIDDLQILYQISNLFTNGRVVFDEPPAAAPEDIMAEPPGDLPAEEEYEREEIEELERDRLADYDDHRDLEDLMKEAIQRGARGYESLRDESAVAWSEEILGRVISDIEYVLAQQNFPNWVYQKANMDKERYKTIGKYILSILPAIPELPAARYEMLSRMGDPWQIPVLERWMMYGVWKKAVHAKILESREAMEKQYRRLESQLHDVETDEDAHYCKKMDVVGMTTSGCAKFEKLMKHLSPKIVLVEEAAEVQETHVVVSMTACCEHLILIGDHQQLRPPTTVYHLARDYHMDISLFERLIKRGVKHATLTVQHRMRPEIARLIVPAIYPRLENHESVLLYPDVLGVKKNVFFLSHNVPEKEDSEQKSHLNPHEADLALRLAWYLLQQGYLSSQITILTTYSGQLLHMRKLRKDQHEKLLGVRITIVDNFQGEENDIIILSLVRSNVDAKIGFLATANRICVALSRAKIGLFIIGNMDSLDAKTPLWQSIRSTLQTHEEIGPALDLVCQIHATVTPISLAGDFSKVIEGGCSKQCQFPLTCGHFCKSICHTQDREHKSKRCFEPCERYLCNLKHGCKKKCYEQCGRCEVRIEKTLPCGHKAITACHVSEAEYKCLEIVERLLPVCGHGARMTCGSDPQKFRCEIPCDFRLDCGHSCVLTCHPLTDANHEAYECKKPCTKVNEGCKQNHTCKKMCCEDCGVCTVKILHELSCGHKHKSYCGKDMMEFQCEQMVDKEIPECGHKVKIECYKIPNKSMCKAKKCPAQLPCGHQCSKTCSEPCSASDCRALVFIGGTLPCGHKAFTYCNRKRDASKEYIEELMKNCMELCNAQLSCGHTCAGSCGKCFQGRLHLQCKSKCGRSLVCGHVCKENCSASCPPCNDLCSYKCPHSQCKKKCGEPCNPCKEPCQWACEHAKCTKRCGEKCNRKRCDKPCTIALQCSHECIGLCGEECPTVCRVCDKEELLDFMLLGNESDPDARFIFLPDCRHAIEVEGMDHWMSQAKSGEVGAKKCPRCNTVITSYLPRYGDEIRDALSDIEKVKKQYYRSKNVLDTLHTLMNRLNALSRFEGQGDIWFAVSELRNRIQTALNKLKKRRNKEFIELMSDDMVELSKVQVDLLFNVCRELRDASEGHVPQKPKPTNRRSSYAPPSQTVLETKPISQMKKELQNALLNKSNFLAKNLIKRTKFSQQEVDDFTDEIERMQLQKGLYFVQSSKLFPTMKAGSPEFSMIYDELDSLLHGVQKLDSERSSKTRLSLKRLSALAETGIGITDNERQMILTAMGLSQGHWYKCPKGHVYCIANCGGAVEESRCNVCGSRIGGTNHTLRTDNQVATEMDGATRPSWPDPRFR